MTNLTPLRFASALAATVAVGYAACTLVFWAFPDASASFMSSLFHGLDFRALRTTPSEFTPASFLFGAGVLVPWVFVLGALFRWIEQRLEKAA